MKRLWVYAFIVTALVSIIFTNRGEVYAQGIDRVIDNGAIPAQGTYDYFQGVIANLNTAAMNAYDAALVGHEKDANYTVLQKEYGDVKAATQKNYDTYLTAYGAEMSNGTSPAKAQILATRAWTSSAQTFNHNIWSSSSIKSAYNQYSNLVQGANLAANQIDRGSIAAGSPEAGVQTSSTTIANAAAGNTNAPKQTQEDPSECSLFSGNLIGCVDTLFAWIIKHTLLQLAGFLVWLSANMLNYSIQISILEFSKWAPSSLYPIWIIIRQIVSLFVVFAGLYLGFMYIIGRTEAFGKYIGWLILFALFVNFSYPFSRALVDVSNIVSLNVYSAAVGPSAVTTDFSKAATTLGQDTAGAQIMNKLGLQGLVASATNITSTKSSSPTNFVNGINSTPGALLAVAFVLYAAYIFFMATAIIVTRTAVLVFLIVASPLLLVDSVIPKLGDAAVKMRKMFVEQLIVAPVFMIMLALTLKFMDIFTTAGTLMGATSGTLATGPASIKTFFGILMMLIMLHIMLKVTKSVAGSAGEYATGFMGKVGGFGLGVATGGAGILARGSVGAAAARARDSGWMDKLQGSRTGRGLYGLSNSLAQSTYDARNVGAVSSTMTKAGMGMGAGSKLTYDQNFANKEKNFNKKLNTIKDGEARQGYLDQTKNSVRSQVSRKILGKSDGDLITKRALESREKKVDMYNTITDPAKKKAYYQENKAEIDASEQEKKKALSSIHDSAVAGIVPTPDKKMGVGVAEGKDWDKYDKPAYMRNGTENQGTSAVPEKSGDGEWVGRGNVEGITAADRKEAAQKAVEDMTPEETEKELETTKIKNEESAGYYRNDEERMRQETNKRLLQNQREGESAQEKIAEFQSNKEDRALKMLGEKMASQGTKSPTKGSVRSQSMRQRFKSGNSNDTNVIDVEARVVPEPKQIAYEH